MIPNATTHDRLWQRRGARGRIAPESEYEAWMLVHEASPSLYVDLLGAIHEKPQEPAHGPGVQAGGGGRLHRLMRSLVKRAVAPGRVGLSDPTLPARADHLHPEPDHA